VPVGNSAAVTAGEPVVALGNAEGRGAIMAAAGQVTGLAQTITATDQGTVGYETLTGMIQVSAGSSRATPAGRSPARPAR
jgi:serine protease Do